MLKVMLFVGLLFPGLLLAEDSDTRVYIKVGEASIKKSLIAVPPFALLSTASLAPNHKQIGTDLFNTIINDIEVSNLFTIIKPEAYLEDPTKVGITPAPGNPTGFHFEIWSKINTEFLIRGAYKISDMGQLEFEIYCYSVPQAKLVLGKTYMASTKDARATAHTFADDLMKALTGKTGIFRTKFVAASDRAGHRWKEIYVMAWDGRDIVQVTNHHAISLSPSWKPNGKTISYSSSAYHPGLKSRNWDLFTYDIFAGKRFLISSRLGMNTGSTFSPDGDWIYLTISKTGDPDIYKINTDGNDPVRLTNGPRKTMNVEPNVSPDSKKIAFSSDRSGNPMIYTIDTDGSNPKRVTFAGKYNSSPCYSPDGKRMAFAGRDGDHFDVFTMNVDGSDMMRLTSAKKPSGRMANNEYPSYSPDGRHIVFTSDRSGKNQIYIISIDGTNERRITVDDYNYFQVRWSPYLEGVAN